MFKPLLAEPAGPLIGRADELVTIEAALAASQLVTLTGVGGMGKTRVAREIAARSPTALPGRFVDLVTVTHPGEVPKAVAAVLDVGETENVDLSTAIMTALARGPSLLVLDNFEHVIGAADFVAELLAGAPDVRVLATSRIRLGLACEVVIQLGPLALPASAETLEDAAASGLFLRRARDRGALHRLAEEDRTAVVALCGRLDGLPLALELAARWTTLLTPRAILRRLDADRLPLAQDGSPRQASLDQVVEWALELAAPQDRVMFNKLGVFVGGFDEPAAAAVTGSANILDTLRGIEHAGLVRVAHDPDGEPQFGMLEPIRAVALRRLGATGEGTAVRRRHVAHFAARALAAADVFRARSWSDERSGAQLNDPNVRAAYDYAVALGDAAGAVSLAASMGTYSARSGLLRETAARIEKALDLGPLPPTIEIDALGALASNLHELGVRDGLVELTERAVALGRVAGSPEREVRTLINSAILTPNPDAESLLEAAAAIADANGYRSGQATAYSNLGHVRFTAGNLESALVAFQRALDVFVADDNPAGEAVALANVGEISANLGQVEEAAAVLRRARALAGDGGNRALRAWVIGCLAAAEALSGRLEVAYADLLDAATARTESDSGAAVAEWLDAATTVLAVEHPVAAARALGAVDGIVERSGEGRPSQRLRDRAAATAERAIGQRRFESERLVGRETDRMTLLAQLEALVRRSAPAGHGRIRGRFGTLTAREQEVLRLLAGGATDAEIAEMLGISAKTASVHVANLKGKLGADTRVGAVLLAQQLVGGEPASGAADWD